MICLIGNVLKERYCIVEQIGHGGGGSLYLAKDMELGICRAVKEIPIAKKKEARLMQHLEYPAIPKIIDYVETGEYCYLIMEYIKGQSLGELLRSGKRFSLREILALGKEIARVLEYLHSRKPPVCYGDLKPDNLMFSETGHLYLIDLGSAMFDHGKRKQICEGTKGYASPEQYQGYLRPGSDIYALGKTLEKLCGKKKWQWILYPDFFWLLFRCTRKQEKYRYSDMSVVQKKIQKLENRYRMITWRKRFLEAAAAGILIGTLILIAGLLKTEEFSVAISEVTDLYYEARQYPEDSKDREKCCMAAEKRLQRLSRNYGEKEQQRRIELLLAWNAELLCEPEKAALFFCMMQNILWPTGNMGCFLFGPVRKRPAESCGKIIKRKKKRNYWMTVKVEICSFGRRSMRKRRESDQKKPKEMKIPSRKACFIVLFLLVLCSWMIPSIAVYGFDVSGMDSFDTGGFDMNVGEGTGQLPEDWEESYVGEGSDDSNWNREEGNTEEYSAAWVESENDQEESAQWNLDFQTDEVRSQEESFMENGNIAAEVEIADTPVEKLTETPIPTKLPILTEQPIPIQTVTASPSVTLTQKPVRKSVTDASKREKKQNPALSYYRIEPTGTSDRKKEKEQKPVIRMKTDGNRIRIEISPDIPFQILSFRINGKECDFYWQGKKLLAELPKKSRNPWKAELMGFVKSGKLYYETMDLPEKQ